MDKPFNIQARPTPCLYEKKAGGFNPIDLPGIKFWYDASDISSIIKDGSDLVSAWNDKTGLGARDLAVNSSGLKPKFFSAGYNKISFAQKFLITPSFALTRPLTIYAVISQIDWVALGNFWDGFAGSDSLAFVQYPTAPRLTIYNGAILDGVGFANDELKVVTIVFDGVTSLIKVNNVVIASGDCGNSSGNPNGLILGSNNDVGNRMANFRISEWLGYAGNQNSGYQDLVYNYLNSKWPIDP